MNIKWSRLATAKTSPTRGLTYAEEFLDTWWKVAPENYLRYHGHNRGNGDEMLRNLQIRNPSLYLKIQGQMLRHLSKDS